ncbi:MAG: DUF4476 domain-containing protein [Chitinophagaceae bacterium]|jgi:hypothetical protein|nr:DUF4476 domain-containing protein [Chitinophagaceae bacterium]
MLIFLITKFIWCKVVYHCHLFTSENNKLPFVKNAYENCMEKHLYFSLGEVFTYNSYKQDFMKWLGDR